MGGSRQDTALDTLPAEVRQVLKGFVKDVTGLFGETVTSILLYGSAARGEFLPGRSNVNLMLVMTRVDQGVLRQYAKAHRRWSREQIVVPLFVSVEEWPLSARRFPLEFLEIREQHVLLSGRDPFSELRVDVDMQDLRLAGERELCGNLMRLRQRFVEGGGGPDAIQMLLSLSVTGVVPAIRGVLVALGRPARWATEECFQDLHDALGVEVDPFREASRLKRGLISPGAVELPRLFDRYTTALHNLTSRLREPGP